jgi:hypothetical protein
MNDNVTWIFDFDAQMNPELDTLRITAKLTEWQPPPRLSYQLLADTPVSYEPPVVRQATLNIRTVNYRSVDPRSGLSPARFNVSTIHDHRVACCKGEGYNSDHYHKWDLINHLVPTNTLFRFESQSGVFCYRPNGRSLVLHCPFGPAVRRRNPYLGGSADEYWLDGRRVEMDVSYPLDHQGVFADDIFGEAVMVLFGG